jgi:uncharacterized protein YndB with AHSA1/START domain
VATTRRTRTIAAPIDRLWDTLADPHHLPRWWPRVERVEDVTDDAFTEVLRAASGRSVRADFELVEVDPESRRVHWAQQLQGTPFARVLRSSEVEIQLTPAPPDATEVTLELHQTLAGFLPRLGSFLARRAAGRTLEEALEDLERIGG